MEIFKKRDFRGNQISFKNRNKLLSEAKLFNPKLSFTFFRLGKTTCICSKKSIFAVILFHPLNISDRTDKICNDNTVQQFFTF